MNCILRDCAFSNVPSNDLLEMGQSHIGCICSVFLHYVFSNVSSKRLYKRMHIGCIGLSFLQCAFSNVSSNRLPVRMHSHIGYIFLLFSTVRFKMCPQIACLRHGKVTLVAFVRLFSTVCFQMSSQITFLIRCIVTLVTFV